MAKREGTGDAGSGAGQLLLPVAVVAAAVLAGCFTAILGARVGIRAAYYLAIVGMLAAGAAVALTRPEPLRFIFLSLLAVLPLVNTVVPPGRIGLNVFDLAVLLLTVGLVLRRAFATPADLASGAALFPARSLTVIWLLLIPCALLAHFPLRSSLALLLVFGSYVFFWFVLQELRRPQGFERLVGLLCMVTLLVSVALYLDYFLHIGLSLRGRNLNQLGSAGTQVWRAGGFFQDPQRAGAFLASLLAFLLVLVLRQRLRGGRAQLLAWAALLCGVPALFMTVSRAAILAFLLVAAVVLVAGSRWPMALRCTGITVLLLVAVLPVMAPQLWSALIPAPLEARLAHSQDEFDFRAAVWLDTWDMFADHPLTGIGFSGFQPYLIETRPMVLNYYDFGADTGVSYVPDQPESGYFKILYETGILGSAAVLLLVVETLRRAIMVLARTGVAAATRSELVAALAGMLAFALTFTTQFTTADPRLVALFAILLAVIWHGVLPATVRARS